MTAPAQYSEHDCRLCGTTNGAVVLRRPKFSIRRCSRCSCMWCDPLRFDATFSPDNEAAYLEVDDAIHAENRGRVEFGRQFAGPATHPKLVEIGCMHGDFVEQAQQAGYQAHGLDLSQTAVDHAERTRPGLVRYGTLDGACGAGTLDIVTAFNVVEHMEHPGEFLDHVYRVLRPGGVFVAETPAQESIYHYALFARAMALRHRTKLEVGMHPGTHIFKFGKRAWTNVLEQRGFDVLQTQPKSTPLRELLAKNRKAPLLFRGGIVGLGLAARASGLGNRILVAARKRG